MRRILWAVAMSAALAAPASAARLYLKDGGEIEAQRVWRADDRVHVLVNRDTLTSFEPGEVNLKKTFPPRRRPARATPHRARAKGAVLPRKTAASRPAAHSVTGGENASAEAAEKKPGRKLPSLPKLPKLPEKSPESLVPSSGSGGTIKQRKKEMSERLAE